MNYYNDNDPKSCAWLRELIAATSSQDQMAGSAFYPEAHDTLDKEPTQTQATGCFSHFSMPRCVLCLVCEPSQEPLFPHKTHTPWEHLGCAVGSEQGLNLDSVCPLIAVGIWLLVRDCACATRALFGRYGRDGRHLNTSTSDSVLAGHGTSFRRHDTPLVGPLLSEKPSNGRKLRTPANRICCQTYETRMAFRSDHMFVFSYTQYTNSLQDSQ